MTFNKSNVLTNLFFVTVLSVLSISCRNDDNIDSTLSETEFAWKPIDGEATTVTLNDEANEFIWKGLNMYYYWQSDVPDLLNSRFEGYDPLYTYLNKFTPEELFQTNRHENDHFSWLSSDYNSLINSFQGINKSFGFEFGLVKYSATSDNLIGFVKYVVANSPASTSGLERGDLFSTVNGQALTISNYRDVLFNTEMYSIMLDTLNPITNDPVATDETVSMSAVVLQEDPILFSSILNVEGLKVGYLVYNQFVNSNDTHADLNTIFGEFMTEGISEMVLDLRYNSGGSVLTAQLLSSMLYEPAGSSTVLGSYLYNDKLAQYNQNLFFKPYVPVLDQNGNETSQILMNRLNLNRIFVLSSHATASASEFLIVGLRPFVDVVLIGDTTVGKNVGSITLVDSPSTSFLNNDNAQINESHTYGMQPIVTQLSNSEGFTSYTSGLIPQILVRESRLLGQIKPLGRLEEHLLAEAIAVMTGTGRIAPIIPLVEGNLIFDSRANKTHLQKALLDYHFNHLNR